MTVSVKRAIAMPGILHERQKSNDGSMEEFRSAISHTKESKAPFNVATYILNPVQVLVLFKRMLDEVYFYTHLEFVKFCRTFLCLT